MNEDHVKFLINLLDIEKLKIIVTDIDWENLSTRKWEHLHWRVKQLAAYHKMGWWSMKDTMNILEFLKPTE